MAQRSIITQDEDAVGSQTWVVPGILLGAYVLTRLPFGMLTGLALGFAAGWSLRAEQGGTSQTRSRRGAAGEEETATHEDEKVDAMSDDSFPASDPPSYTAARTGKPRKS